VLWIFFVEVLEKIMEIYKHYCIQTLHYIYEKRRVLSLLQPKTAVTPITLAFGFRASAVSLASL
jgi:hypothetical protein